MIVHNFSPVFVDLGFLQIRWYSLAYILGIVLGWVYAAKIIKITSENKYNFEPIKKSYFDDLIIYLVLGIIFGGRLGYVLFYNLEYYSQNIFEIFKIWQGGMSFHGGLVGIIVSILVKGRRILPSPGMQFEYQKRRLRYRQLLDQNRTRPSGIYGIFPYSDPHMLEESNLPYKP